MALSDPTGTIASPYAIIERADDGAAVDSIIAIIGSQQVERVIAGLPLRTDGSSGPQAEKVKQFVGLLATRTSVPVEYRDESLSTVTARNIMRVSRSRKNRRKSRDDDVAAAVILQEYLDETGENTGAGVPAPPAGDR